MSTNLAVLDGMRTLMEMFDDLHDAFENIMSMSEKYEDRLQPFNDADITNPDTIQQVLEGMPPGRASALTAALTDLAKFAPSNEQNDKKAMELFESIVQLIKTIRANLHVALDEKS